MNELKVQGIMMRDASEMIYKSYDDYINIFKMNKDPQADDWMATQHQQFNYKLTEILRRLKPNVQSTQSLSQAIAQLKTPIAQSAIALQARIDQVGKTKMTKSQIQEKCEMACGIFKTDKC